MRSNHRISNWISSCLTAGFLIASAVSYSQDAQGRTELLEKIAAEHCIKRPCRDSYIGGADRRRMKRANVEAVAAQALNDCGWDRL
jgi:hypothetical protein